MNKNTVIGITLIGLILIGFSVYNSKVAREQMEIRRVQDSIAAVRAIEYAQEMASDGQTDTGAASVTDETRYSSTYANSFLEEAYKEDGDILTLENDKIRVDFSTRGAHRSRRRRGWGCARPYRPGTPRGRGAAPG